LKDFDLIIKNGRVVDGSGNPWFRADIAVSGEKIAKIGYLSESRGQKVIDADGLMISPGFIDIHTHADHTLFSNPRCESYVHQGVTTVVMGNCGLSVYPIDDAHREDLISYLKPFTAGTELAWDWHSLKDFLNKIEERGVGINVVPLVGHGAVRIAVMGFEGRNPTEYEMEQMKLLIAQAMEDGCFGLSTGLVYPPGVYSKSGEIIELCKVVATYDGFYATHMRDIKENLSEMIEIGEKAALPVEISHLNSSRAFKEFQGNQDMATSKLIEEARERGIDITCDVYPYTAGSTLLSALIPAWAQEGGLNKMLERLEDCEIRKRLKQELEDRDLARWDKFVISFVKSDRNKKYEGKSLQEIANMKKISPMDALCEILIDERAEAMLVSFLMVEEDIKTLMKHYAVMIASDGWALAPYGTLSVGKPHPRCYGTFPRVLGKYVREEKLFSLQDAIRKMTSMPAQKLGLRDRGLLREGMCADIVVFDPRTIIDESTYTNPHRYPKGISCVIVNGELIVEDNRHTGLAAGRTLRKELCRQSSEVI